MHVSQFCCQIFCAHFFHLLNFSAHTHTHMHIYISGYQFYSLKKYFFLFSSGRSVSGAYIALPPFHNFNLTLSRSLSHMHTHSVLSHCSCSTPQSMHSAIAYVILIPAMILATNRIVIWMVWRAVNITFYCRTDVYRMSFIMQTIRDSMRMSASRRDTEPGGHRTPNSHT